MSESTFQFFRSPFTPAYWRAAFRELKIVYDIHGWQTLIEAMKTFQDRS